MKTITKLKSILHSLTVCVLVVLITSTFTSNKLMAQSKPIKNWAEKLGYPAGKKVIMLHADDIGMCEEANIAADAQMKNDYIQ